MKRTFNDRIVRSLDAAEPGTRYEIMDAIVPGFGVRLTDKGTKTFILIARYPGSENPTRRALGEYGELTLDQARAMARDWLDLIARGVDPREDQERQRLAEQRKRENTFAAVAEDFIEGQAAQRDERAEKSSGTFVASSFRLGGAGPITDITALDVRAVVKRPRIEAPPYQAHNLLDDRPAAYSIGRSSSASMASKRHPAIG